MNLIQEKYFIPSLDSWKKEEIKENSLGQSIRWVVNYESQVQLEQVELPGEIKEDEESNLDGIG